MTNLQTNYVLNLLNKCIDNIRSVITSSSHTKQKNMIISRSLKLLRQIIEKSEINGTGRIKSHYGLIKQKVLKININDDMTIQDLCSFCERLAQVIIKITDFTEDSIDFIIQSVFLFSFNSKLKRKEIISFEHT